MKFCMKVYHVEKEVMVAVCDESILGEVFEEGEKRLDISREFYGTESYTRGDVARELRGATIANLSGREAVAIGVEEDIIEEENVLEVEGVPHAQYATL